MKRTSAMNGFVAAYLVMFGVLVVFLLNVLGVVAVFEMPTDGDPTPFVVMLVLFGAVMLAVIAAALWWSRAPRSPRFWALGAIPGVLFFLPDIPIVIEALTSPRSIAELLFAVAVTASVVVLIVSAAMAFRDARRAAASG